MTDEEAISKFAEGLSALEDNGLCVLEHIHLCLSKDIIPLKWDLAFSMRVHDKIANKIRLKEV